MPNIKLRRPGYLIFGCTCIALGMLRITTGKINTEDHLFRTGVSIEGPPAVILGIVVLLYGCYSIYLSFKENKC